MKLNSSITAAIAAIYEDLEQSGAVDTELLKQEVGKLLDRALVLSEPWESISDYFIALAISRLVDKLADPEYRAMLLAKASERSVRFRDELKKRLDERK